MEISKILHPVVYRDILAFKNAGLYRPHPSPGSEEHRLLTKVMTQHGAIWMKQYGRGFWAAMIAALASFCAVFYWIANTNSSFAPVAMPIYMGSVLVVAGIALAINRRKVSALELRNFLPVLGLSPVRKAYCEALLNVQECTLIDTAQKQEMICGLNELIETDCRLDRQIAGLDAATGSDVAAPVEDLERRVRETTDPEARAALVQAWEQATARVEAGAKLAPLRARVEAQKELLVQTVRSVGENVARLNLASQGAPSLDMDALRRNVREIEEQTDAVERAVQELGGAGV